MQRGIIIKEEWQRMRAALILMMLAILAAPCSLGAQTMATMTTAAISAEGEGGLFMMAGSDLFRAGVLSRFLLSKDFDMGLQAVFDRYEEKGFIGLGFDIKFRIPVTTSTTPIDIALDAGAGLLEASDRRRIFLAPGILVSGRAVTAGEERLEPYLGLYALFSRRSWKGGRCETDSGLACQVWDEDFRGEAMLRAGMKIPLRKDFQLLVEMNVNGDVMFGAGVNIVF
jgi:hypothetical protein